MIKMGMHSWTVSIFSTKIASNNIWRLRFQSRSVLLLAVIHSVEKNLLPKTWKTCSQEKITKVSQTTLFSRLSLNKEIFLGVLLQTATMHSYSIAIEIVVISNASNAKKSIAWIANLKLTRGSLVKNSKETVILTSLIKLLISLCEARSSNSAQPALCGSKRLMAATTWAADVEPNSAMFAAAFIIGVTA